MTEDEEKEGGGETDKLQLRSKDAENAQKNREEILLMKGRDTSDINDNREETDRINPSSITINSLHNGR
uniref:Uncharacterized protein n=1 Tax=Pristionchus pacificus TaxID=54126 RepID=A0A2A6B814_PRIPA|eukprot:PDM62030.1 hypothetical protein PRIPAC_51472 [Pristionchus pacificus]